MYTPPGDPKNELAARLAQKSGLSEELAHKFLDALSDVTNEDAQNQGFVGSLPAHTITIPLIELEDGTIAVNTSGYSAWTPFAEPKPTPKEPPQGDPPATPGKPYHPLIPAPGGYPGPSVFIKVNDWLGSDMDLGEGALGRLRDALGKSQTSFSDGSISASDGYGKLKGK